MIIRRSTGISIGLMITLVGLAFTAGKLWKDHDLLVTRVIAIEGDRKDSLKEWSSWRQQLTTDVAVIKEKVTIMVPDGSKKPVGR